MSGMDETEKQATLSEVIVVMVPFPAQGHLNQLLHLSRLISSYAIPVHYVSTTIHSRQAKLRIQGWDPLSTMIKFHELSIPAFSSPPPDPHSAVKFPCHLLPAFDAALLLRAPVAELLSALYPTTKRIVIIYDFMIPSVIQDVASIPNGEAYSFQSLSAFRISSYHWETVGRPLGIDDQIVKQVPTRASTLTPQVMEFFTKQEEHNKYSSGAIFNTCKAIEAPFLDLLAKVNKKQWAVGPFNPIEICKNNSRHKCLEWLDKQAPNSVIFVSFGTTTSLTNEQIESLAVGLENSGQKFIWVLRDADRADIFAQDARARNLPKEYEEKNATKRPGNCSKGLGTPVGNIGAHINRGFMSHCGWNSCMESISMGVPIATWPMHSDQPHNAVLVTEVLKIGIVVRDWAVRDELVESFTIENAVRELMASRQGHEIRKRTVELGKAVKGSVEDGGDSRIDIHNFIAHIKR